MDLLIERDGRLIPVEIKSSSTFSTDFVSGIRHFRSVFGETAAPGWLLFNGDVPPAVVHDGVRLANPAATCPFYP